MRRLAVFATAAMVVASGGLAGATSDLVDAPPDPVPLAEPLRDEVAREPAQPAPPRRAEGPLAAEVLRRTPLRARPGGRIVARIGRRTEFAGRQMLAVVARRGRWLGVLHPALANSRAGWIRIGATRLYRAPWRIAVDLSERMATVTRDGRVVERFRVGIGAPGSPTPTGRFAVTDRLVNTDPRSVYGCCILALTGRQPSLPAGWSGGDRLALHGTPGDDVGGATSGGCLSAKRGVLRRLLKRLTAGTRVDVRA